jgi:hypothetical protein
MIKRILALFILGTLPILAEPQFNSFDIWIFYCFVFISKVLELLMFLSPLIFLVIVVIVINKIFNKKKQK